MRTHRGIVLLLCLLASLAGVGVAVFGFGTETAAAELTPSPDIDAGQGQPMETPSIPAADIAPVEGPFRRSEPAGPAEATAMTATTEKRTSGLIRGDVTLAANVVDKLDAITIRVLEAMRADGDTGHRRPFVYQHTIKFDVRDGTPRFAFDEIPFSDFGYLVQVFVPGMNGTEQMVQVNEQHPIADVVLGLHPGTPFSVLVREQDLAPLTGTEVTLAPEGDPPGRPAYPKVTDSFGAAVFENVLRGKYTVHIGPMSTPLTAPEFVEVLANSGTQAQSKTIVVAKGETLTVSLFNASSHGIPDVEVKLSPGSDTRYRERPVRTDYSGRAEFKHLAPGSYWINVHDNRYEPRTVSATIRKGEKPKDIEIRMRMR